MDSTYIKGVLYQYFRFSRRCPILATEVGQFSSDFFAIEKNKKIEIEIKISEEDFSHDFSKKKHRIYEQLGTLDLTPWIPHYFYFAVPESMIKYGLNKLNSSKYGLIGIRELGTIDERILLAKRATLIHNGFTDKIVKDILVRRMSSEVANFYKKITN